MFLSKITIENFRCFGKGNDRFELDLKPGLTALVGENDGGKSAVVDALRFALGTTDQEWHRLEPTDFHDSGEPGGSTTTEITVICKFEKLNHEEMRAFVEHLTHSKIAGESSVLYINWTAKHVRTKPSGRTYWRPETHSGKDGKGPSLPPGLSELLRATYLRPLRDAEHSLSAGRGSRVSQVLNHIDEIKSAGEPYNPSSPVDPPKLNLLGIIDLANDLLSRQEGIKGARGRIDDHLGGLSLRGDNLKSKIEVGGADEKEEMRLRQLLEKLDLGLAGRGRLGLGSNGLLFMACELLLLVQEDERNKLLLIEEPEAHLHAQRQLRVMKFMQEQDKEKQIQILVTTHSPNLASAIKLENIVIIRDGRAYSLARGETQLDGGDYRFLERFLDVTKANLFFARGVMIVEGDAENILIPTLANIIGKDFTHHGVSIVNVGGVGLSRYARIFLRQHPIKGKELDIPVACLTDMDVMPNCAPLIVGRLKIGETWPIDDGKRQWRAKRDFASEDELSKHRDRKVARANGQWIRTFVSDEWTFEYDLALGPKADDGTFRGGLAEDVFVAACLAKKDKKINSDLINESGTAGTQPSFWTQENDEQESNLADVEKAAEAEFAALCSATLASEGCLVAEVMASKVYAKFVKEDISKPVAAQYLAERLIRKVNEGVLTPPDLRARLPKYLTEAIDYVTGTPDADAGLLNGSTNEDSDAAR
jgi:putative ATP-dependent endonuclease of OLD family